MGFATVSGGSRATAPGTVLASDLAVGSTVKLLESGSAAEYLVVNQGKPSGSSLYDDSCDGTWLLRKDIYNTQAFNSSNKNTYSTSSMHSYLNSTFLNLFDGNTQGTIKQVTIMCNNTGNTPLSCKVFLLSFYEVGWTTSDYVYVSIDGAKLSYFDAGTGDAANNKRVAYLNGTATTWWLRTPENSNTKYVRLVWSNGGLASEYATNSYGVRPALILPSNAKFDADTMILKGVA